jgi:suppressor of ftsI
VAESEVVTWGALRSRRVVVALVLAAALAAAAIDALSGRADTTPAGGAPLSQPAIYRSHHGVLNVTLVASEKRVTIAGQSVVAKVYNGSFVAPTLMVKPDDLIRVKLVNHLHEPTNLHFHGLEVTPNGHGDNIFLSINPGHTFQYSFRLPRDAPTGTYWYHSHEMVPAMKTSRRMARLMKSSKSMAGMQMSAYPNAGSEEQVFDGLSGMLEVQGLRDHLDPSLREVPERYLALRDVQIENGQIVTSDIDSNAPTTRLVDGQVDPKIAIAPGGTQLWHIANIGADIFYRLILPGHTFEVVAQDGHPTLRAHPQGTLLMPPGKRFDVLVRGTTRGSTPLETLPYNEGDDHYPQVTLATLDTGGARERPARLPVKIEWSRSLAGEHAVRDRTIIFSENEKTNTFFINGRSYDPSKVDFHARLNTVEQWTITNQTDEIHVFHMHTYPMQLMSVNGVPVRFDGYQDEIVLPRHGYVVMRVRFEGFTGETVFHCHILSHEDAGMMANIEVSR